MNKRITSIVLSFVMLFTMLATAVPVLAAGSTSFKMTADKTEAHPGDIITYTVTMGAVTNLDSLKIKLDIPAGLTFVTGSGKITEGLATTMNVDGAEFTESTMVILIGNAKAQDGYTSTLDTEIMKFQCKVDADASGNKTVNFIIDEDEVFEAPSGGYDNIAFTTSVATVNVTIPHVHVYDKETLDYLVSPATCTSPAVYHKSCTCGAEGTETFTSGSALGHDYTKKVENNTYLKTAASNCTEYNVYWYACSRCDANAKDDAAATDKYYTSTTAGNHSFTEKIEDAAHYVAGTGTDCQSVKKYYFDCAYCDLIGTTTWDSTTYGPHNYAATWSSDADGHWHECSLCHGKKDEAAHTPGAAATETTPQKCTECDYTITPALGHTHHMTLVDGNPATCTADGNKAYYVCSGCSKWFEDATGSVEITDHSSVVIGHLGHDFAPATCTTPKTCKRDGCDATEGIALGHDWKDATCTAPKTCQRDGCGATEGEPNGHTEGTDWKNDANYHWHICSVDGCGAVIESSKAAHTPDREAATETEPVKCSVCDYEIAPALGMQDYILEMPVFVSVKLTGDEKPGKETFKLEIYDCGVEDAEFEILNDVLTAEDLEFVDGGAYFYGVLKIKVTGQEQLFNLTEGFKVRMVKGTAKGWTYASEQWYVMPIIFEGTTDAAFYFGYDVREIVDGEISEIPANGMSFTLGYEAVTGSDPTEPDPTEPDPTEPGKPADPQTPQTGDNSMMGLWIALLFVSGVGVVGTTIYSRKKKYSVK